MSHFEELKTWQEAFEFAFKVYEITTKDPFSKYFSLRDRMRRSSARISSNISEGDRFESDKSSVRHFRISEGSTAELYTQSIIAFRIGYLDYRAFEYIKNDCHNVLAILTT